MSLHNIIQWHRDARPSVTDRDLTMSFAVHVEEFIEMLECISVKESMTDVEDRLILASVLDDAEKALGRLYKVLRYNDKSMIQIDNREAVLDSIADQIVTAAGVGVAAGMDVEEAVKRVSDSNDSKRLSDGTFARDATGKITKPSHYTPPNLTGLY
jgi:predicted HAD superfamily Cof-like phosphohydrolase